MEGPPDGLVVHTPRRETRRHLVAHLARSVRRDGPSLLVVGSVSQTLIVDIPSAWWLTSNGRYKWPDKARRTKHLRTIALLEARRQHLEPVTGMVSVIATVHYRTAVRADPANAQPTLKALVDGCTDAGIWVDDDSTHLIGPDPRRGCNLPGLRPGEHRIVLTITPDCN